MSIYGKDLTLQQHNLGGEYFIIILSFIFYNKVTPTY